MSPCIHPACGQPRHVTGKAPKGWIFAKVSGTPGAWYCTPACAWAAISAEPAPPKPKPAPPPTVLTQPRPDIAHCPLCANRHDRDHRCSVCNTRPQVVHAADRTVELYQHHTTNTQERTA